MIRELRIEGFKSFGVGTIPMYLGPLTFFVGANASGKTNIISALRFLRTATLHNVEIAVDDFGGLAEVRNKILRERRESKPLALRLKLAPLAGRFRMSNVPIEIPNATYELKLHVRKESGLPEIVSEDLVAEVHSGDKAPSEYRLSRTSEAVEIDDPLAGSKKGRQRLPVPPQERLRLAVGVGFYSLPCVLLRSYIEGWSFFNISPQVARAPYKESAEVNLGSAGEYLSVILHKMEKENGKDSLETIIAGIKGAIPGFKGIKTTQLPVENKWAFQVLEDRIRGAINPESVSDGTIRLLALMVISVWSSRRSSLLAIEEPENGLHPHLAEHIVSVLRDASQHRQILVTTHNPAFLDFLEPKEVLLCDKIEGFTKVKSAADIAEVTQFKRRFRLGELWEQGVLGGIP
jgi:predicted ATPase